MSLQVRTVTVELGGTTILRDVSLDVGSTEVVVLLGPSGSGKTTLLRTVAGLVPHSSGSVRWDEEDLAPVPTHRRGFGMVFQDYALFPHLTVARNVAFGLEVRSLPTERRVNEALAMVGLEGFGSRHIDGLSGGEQQRVALARALVTDPRLLLLDEPLGALDAALRERLIEDLGDLLAPLPAIYVTHDREEAMALGDRIALMRDGSIVRTGTPESIWSDPKDTWTARFIGHGNVFDASFIPTHTIHEDEHGPHWATVLSRRFTEGLWRSVYRLADGRELVAHVRDPGDGPAVRLRFEEQPLDRVSGPLSA